MTSLSSQRLRLVAGLVALNLVLIVGGWLLLVSPQRHHSTSAGQQVAQVRDEVGRLQGPQTTSSHASQPAIDTKELYRLAQAMPPTADLPDLLLGLDQLARASGVHVGALSPQAATAGTGYTIIPVSLTVTGNYATITRFLHRLRTLVSLRHGQVLASGRLFSISSVALAPGKGKALTATVSLQAYAYGAVDGVAQPSTSTSTDSTSTGSTTGS